MVRFGIIGTGTITNKFLKAASLCRGFSLGAVYSRSVIKGGDLAIRYGLDIVYDDLDELAESEDIDAVYIASPISCHAEQAVKMLKNGKHVLCEKTAASNSRELSEVLGAARENGVVFLEAMRTVFEPGYELIRKNLYKLGPIRRVTANYCQYSSRYDDFKMGKIENAFNPKLSNSALTDIGVYCVHPVVALFGAPNKIMASGVFLANGFEGEGTIVADYGSMTVEMIYSKISNAYSPSEIQGENGSMIIEKFHSPQNVKIIYRDGNEERFEIERQDDNMVYEIQKFIDIIEKGQDFKEYNAYSRMALQIMDEAREITGIHFPADEKC